MYTLWSTESSVVLTGNGYICMCSSTNLMYDVQPNQCCGVWSFILYHAMTCGVHVYLYILLMERKILHLRDIQTGIDIVECTVHEMV